ncbi:MAG: hypothetical protein ACE5QV_05355, partial [Fidelibacterota bacterium]
MRGKIYVIAVVLISFLFTDFYSLASTPQSRRGHEKYRRKGIMDGNLIRTIFLNHGEVAHWPDQPSGEWPKGTGHSYVDGVALIVAVEARNREGAAVHPMETMYREFVDVSPEGVPWGWAPRPGWFNPDPDENDSPALSNNPLTWPDHWPDRDESWDGYWNGFFGKGVMNADLETVFVFDDDRDREPQIEMNYYPDPDDTTRGGIGLWVKSRGFQWSHVLAEDVIFWLYRITNESKFDYNKTYYAQYIDYGVGGTDDSNDDVGMYDVDLDIAYAWDDNGFGSPGNWYPVGVVGYAFLESPGNSWDGIDNDGDGIIDERRDDGIDNDSDWRGFEDMNGNGVWDIGEPLNDDLGADGVGPFDIQYTDPDEGEGDGLPTPGEPNFDATDPDESDQIGLTGFEIFAVHYYELWDDEQNWQVFVKALPPREDLLSPPNLGMFF